MSQTNGRLACPVLLLTSSNLSFHHFLDFHEELPTSFDGLIELAIGGTVGFVASPLTCHEKQPHFPQMSCFDAHFCDSEQMISLCPVLD